MKYIDLNIDKGARATIAGAPEGVDAQLLGRWARTGQILHIARDDQRLTRLEALVRFFAPAAEVLTFPAWDCLPYDRASPHVEIVAQRLATLGRLARDPDHPRLILTTVSAASQRVPTPNFFASAVFPLAAGGTINRSSLQEFLNRNGYRRAETVREPGEYAFRGGLIDLFPTGADVPSRLDLFGDEIEAIRDFDPMSQRSLGSRNDIRLGPVSEVPLDEAAIRRFRSAYRELARRTVGNDPLYEAVSAGRRHGGMEHWLPLFHEELATIFDYLASNAAITLDPQTDEAFAARRALVEEYYEARSDHEPAEDPAGPYHPVRPEAIYLTAQDMEARLAERPAASFSAFQAPEYQPNSIDAGGRGGQDFSEARRNPEIVLFDAVRDTIVARTGEGKRALIAAYSAGSCERLTKMLNEHGLVATALVKDGPEAENLPPDTVAMAVLDLERGFVTDGLSAFTEQDILGDRLARVRRGRRKPEDIIREAGTLTLGDLVVHMEHGIGRYDGLESLEVAGAPHDCLRLLYDGGDRLFLPVENLEVLSRFGGEDSSVPLDKLGGAGWQARKARVKGRLKDMAEALIKIAAAREVNRAPVMKHDAGAYDEFAARFPFEETDDQQRAIADVLADLDRGRPMDRLICGDVGFGKTEVALRAAFNTVLSGYQVAVVVPTTLLARQHGQTFKDRFAGFPVRVGRLSRLIGAKEQAETRDGLADGTVDIVIGTHALLSKSIEIKNLGLLIVDEEQHFGVKQKERLKDLRANIHVLTLTATPIPRTLQMALTGVRDMSLIATPPVDRLAVRTFVSPYDPVVIREAIQREMFRGGQTFYVCPRIEDLPRIYERLEKLVPDARIVTAHGQMSAGELEDAMGAFYGGAHDILLSTNIIESGLDIPTANTLIVHRADMFGLAQLYQLRGRVGRSKTRAYAYLTLPPGKQLTVQAEKRLQVMQTLDALGAGFTLASYDMDIRGAGNLLGEEQSGHVREVGVELYQRMLEEAVAEARDTAQGTATAVRESWSPQIGIGMPVMIPETYVPDLGLRLSLYRRAADLTDESAIEAFAAELIDRFGPLPDEVENLMKVLTIKALCRAAGVEKVDAGPKGATVSFRNGEVGNPAGLVQFISEAAGMVKLRPDHTLVYRRQWPDAKSRVEGVAYLIKKLIAVAT